MISKGRLKKLINQKATIWADGFGKIQLCDNSEVCKTITFTRNHQIQEGYCLNGFINNEEFINDNIEPDELEENAERGEWNFEMHTNRLERFEPPVWEDFVDIISPKGSMSYDFVSKDKESCEIYVDFSYQKITILGEFGGYGEWQLSKENYIKACTIARKLFLGESLEDENKGENE